MRKPRVGDRLYRADGRLYHVRAVLAEDEQMVLRTWGRSGWRYVVEPYLSLEVGLFTYTKRYV